MQGEVLLILCLMVYHMLKSKLEGYLERCCTPRETTVVGYDSFFFFPVVRGSLSK